MKRTSMRAGAAALLAAASLTGNAWAGCVADADMAALKVAALQQKLMVAAFSCHDVDLYNRFVLAHQPELIRSDARLMAYFVQRDGGRRGEASYHSYKTELANTSSLSSLHNDDFCDGAHADFDATEGHANLTAVLDIHRWAIETAYRACHSNDARALADASSETAPFPIELGARDARDGSTLERSLGGRRQDARSPDRAGTFDVKSPAVHPPLGGGDSL